MERNQLEIIKSWLGTGSINIFGLPMSGKDTVGIKLAALLGANFLSSGEIIRKMESEQNNHMTESGELIPTNVFYDWVLPYFAHKDLENIPLVLSSIGRWSGEEDEVMKSAASANHPIKAVILLDLEEDEVRTRWSAAKKLNDRGDRGDDNDPAVFETRINEFHEKTGPVLSHYQDLGLLLKVPAVGTREEVLANALSTLADFAKNQ